MSSSKKRQSAPPAKEVSPRLGPAIPSTGTTRAEVEKLLRKAADAASRSPEKAAIILTDWISRPARSGKSKKSA